MSTYETQCEQCPRCGGPLQQFPADRGALSRSDNETVVCEPCGFDEAFPREAPRLVLPSWIDHLVQSGR